MSRLTGFEELRARLRRMGDTGVQIGLAALYQEGERIMTDAKRRAPVLTGALRSSGQVTPDEGVRPRVVLSFGNNAVTYAVYVHENLRARHPVGEAKFLENALLAAARGMEGRLAKGIAEGIARAAR